MEKSELEAERDRFKKLANDLILEQIKLVKSHREELEVLVKSAHEEGALAMSHYYHGEYAREQFKMDHASRALRPEHIEWAKKALAHARAILGGRG